MSEREKLVEVMKAGAIAAGKGEPSWADCVTDDEWEAALAALEAAGVRLVPAEATEEMLAELVPRPAHWPPEGERKDMDAAILTDRIVIAQTYRRLLAASPYAKDKPE
jgi:hypothetical protein